MDGYWSRTISQRFSRRQALKAAGGTSLGAALLAACGGGSGQKDAGPKDTSGLLSKPEDTTKQAKRNGTLRAYANFEPITLDAYGGGPITSYFELTYNLLFAFKMSYLKPEDDDYEGAIAESWEWSPDHLQLNTKLRQGVKFHDLPPVNGRAMDTDDILFSWKRFSAMGSNRTTVANSASPDAPVLSITTPDSGTAVIKFKEPLVYALAYLANRGYTNIVPKEAENPQVLDLRNRIIGTGPFMLTNYRPSVGLTFKRNPFFWNKDRPLVEQIEFPIVTEYAAGVSQFRAGNMHFYPVNQSEVVKTKRELPDLVMQDGGVAVDGRRMCFGWQTVPLRDKRVRQAISMSIARDDWIAANYNTDAFTGQGLPVTTRWHTALQGTDNSVGWWLDPKDKPFGPNAKYFQRDIAEAKKLLAAAGFPDGLEIQSNYFTTNENGVDYAKLIDVFESMASESGFKFKKNIIPYTEFLQKYRDTHGMFAGVAYKNGPPAPGSDPVNRLVYEFSVKGGIGFHGFDAQSRGIDGAGDPQVESQLEKAKQEFDKEKRRALVHDLQRYLADQQYTIRWPGGATSFDLTWPALKNYRTYIPSGGSSAYVAYNTWWVDDTLPPNNKS